MGCGASSSKKEEKPTQKQEEPKKTVTVAASNDDDEPEHVAPKNYDRKRRSGVSAEAVTEADLEDETPLPVYPKSDEVKARIRKAITMNLLFKHLSEKQVDQIIDAMTEVTKKAGESVITQGGTGEDADHLYIVESGVCEVYIKKSSDPEPKLFGEIKPGGYFGELALMYQTPRAATVKAKEDAILWAVDRKTFRRVLLVSILQRRKMFEEFLSSVPLLDAMSSYETSNLCDALRSRTLVSGDTVYKEGEPGEAFYLVEEGTVKVTRGGKEISTLSRGECFGEVVLLTTNPYDATVTAVGPVKLAWIDRTSFNDLLGPCIDMLKRNMGLYRALKQSEAYGKAINADEDKDASTRSPGTPGDSTPTGAGRKRRQGVSSEALVADETFVPKVIKKTNEQISRIRNAISHNFLFSSLSEDLLRPVIDAMFEVNKSKGDIVMKQGDEGDNFYILEEGDCEFWINEKKVGKGVSAGGSFGELALMYNTPRAATVRVSSSKALLWGVDRQTFRQLVLTSTLKKRRLYEEFLSNCPILDTLTSYEKSTLADALSSQDYHSGSVIIQMGSNGDTFYILAEGEAVAVIEEKTVKELHPGDYFGEIALLEKRPRAADVIAKTPVTVLSLESDAFHRLLGPIEDILRRNMNNYQTLLDGLKEKAV